MTERTSEMVERVALAIATHPDGGNVTPGSNLLTRNNVSQWDGLARAAIAAMREPTEEMLMRSVGTHALSSCIGVDEHWARCAWRAMIDAALAEPPQQPETPASGAPTHAQSHPESGGAG